MTAPAATSAPAPHDHAVADRARARTRRRPWARDALRRRLLALADATAVVVCMLALGVTVGDGAVLVAYVAATVALLIVVAKVLGLYDRDHRYIRHQALDELPSVVAFGAIATAESVIALTFLGAEPKSGVTLTQLAFALPLLVAVLRALARWLWRSITPPERVVIVGSGAIEHATRRKFALLSLHAKLTATLEDGDVLTGPGLPKLVASLDALALTQGGTDRLIVADAVDETVLADLVPLCRRREIKLGLIPPARGMFGTAVQLDHIGELPVVQFNTWDVSRTTQWGKRAVDVVGSIVALALTAPLMPVIALLIRHDSPGPALFRQRRSGKDGVPFTMLKFRTMVEGAEERLEDVLVREAQGEHACKLKDDPRRTRVGRILRRTSLDEVPQFFNVLRGEMSLVGPRPEQTHLVERYSADVRRIRLAVKPGITGPMQISGRGDMTLEERVAVERDYVEKLSLRRDIAILLMTLPAVVRQRGAW